MTISRKWALVVIALIGVVVACLAVMFFFDVTWTFIPMAIAMIAMLAVAYKKLRCPKCGRIITNPPWDINGKYTCPKCDTEIGYEK